MAHQFHPSSPDVRLTDVGRTVTTWVMFPFRDHNPSQRLPVVTMILIGANVLVFAGYLSMFGNERALAQFYFTYGLVPAKLSAGSDVYAVLTSMFLHGGFMHLAGNMLFLWIFGDNLEDEMGHVPFLLFYIAGGVVASLAQYGANPLSRVPVVGASGAIAGVLGGYLLLFPKARVDVLIVLVIFFRVFTVPAWLMLGLWFGMQILGGVGADPSTGGVAYWAHAGGFVAGLVLALPVWLRRGATGFWQRTHGQPDHPETRYKIAATRVPRVRRR